MKINEEIIHIIKENRHIPVPVTEASHLYIDVGFDSLAFVYLLVRIEEAYGISFALVEMERCLWVRQLILLVESKVKEAGNDSASVDKSEETG